MTANLATYEEEIKKAALRSHLELNAATLKKIMLYVEHLLTVNKKLNLTRITDPLEMAVKHFEDSWTLLPILDDLFVDGPVSVLDVGTGAGFPGYALKLVRPEMELTVIESVGKKAAFLLDVNKRLRLDVTVLNGRAEVLAHDPAYRDQFDFVTARAVAALDVLVELCLPFVKKGGLFVSMRGQEEGVPDFMSRLAATLREIRPLVLTGDLVRTLYVFLKVGRTPKGMPREMKKILKKRPS